MDIRLNHTTSKSSVNQNMAMNVDLQQNGQLLPVNDGNAIIDLEELYRKERAESDKVRIIATIRPVCSNVLFNRMTEIVRSEGSGSVEKLPDADAEESNYTNDMVIGKPSGYEWNEYQAVRDTQLSNKRSGFQYKCGMDIFNNHILRNKMFRKVCLNKGMNEGTSASTAPYSGDSQFNTIDDYMRNETGKGIRVLYDPQTGRQPVIASGKTSFIYSNEDVYTYAQSVSRNLRDVNGWLGFVNKANMPIYDIYPTDKHVNRVINSKNGCDFIEMYPDSSLFTFSPKYNKFMNREEKNWNYCLTYPYSSVTKPIMSTLGRNEFSFMTQDGKLKACGFDDQPNGVNGLLGVYSVCKHGLKIGDKVNVYVNGTLYIAGGDVMSTGNDQYDDGYYFSVRHDNLPLYSTWVTVGFDEQWLTNHFVGTLNNKKFYYDGASYFIYDGTSVVYPANYNPNAEPPLSLVAGAASAVTLSNGRVPLIMPSDKANHPNGVTITYAKIVGGQECRYYVQVMRRVPNWKGASIAVDTAARTNESVIANYITHETEFATSNMKLGFSKTIYGDDLAQITFDDDVVLTDLKDNLGRPLSEVYLTVIKNNKGYEKWYGKDSTKWPEDGSLAANKGVTKRTYKEWIAIPNEDRFAEIKSKASNRTERWQMYNALKDFMGSVEFSHCFGAVSCGFVNSYESMSETDSNKDNVLTITPSNSNGLSIHTLLSGRQREVLYEQDTWFYGDICCFSPYEYIETHISELCFRFNTQQRETTGLEYAYDEVNSGDSAYISVANHSTKTKDKTYCPEGYYYKAHYPIKIHGFSERVFRQYPKEFDIQSLRLSNLNGTGTTYEENYAEVGDVMYIHNYNKVKTYKVTVKSVIDNYTFTFASNSAIPMNANPNDYKLERPDATIPSYAVMMKNNCQFVWREFVKNGCDGMVHDDELAFTNGAYYIFPDITFYLKRQDPHDLVWTYSLGKVSVNNRRHGDSNTSHQVDLEGMEGHFAKIDAVFDEMNIRCN